MTFEINSILDIAALYDGKAENDSIHFTHRKQHNLDCLIHLIGEARLARICQRPEVSVDLAKTNLLKKSELRRIFIGMLDCRLEDYEDSHPHCPYSTIEELESLFLNQIPTIDTIDKPRTSGKGLEGLAEKVYLQGLHHLNLASWRLLGTQETTLLLSDGEMLTSRLADREMQKGCMIQLSDGDFVVDQTFVAGGAYVSALRNFNHPFQLKLVCRGTAMRSTATGGYLSGLNDLLIDVGMMGVKSIWPEILQYFREQEIDEVEILGKSLGGSIAQELAVLIEGVANVPVKTLTTYASVGVSDSVHKIFNKVHAEKAHTMHINVVRNGSSLPSGQDLITSVGGMHLGVDTPNAQVKVYYLHDSKEASSVYSTTLNPGSIASFLFSGGMAHMRQITLLDFNWTVIEDSEDVQTELTMGAHNDSYRINLAHAINFITMGKLNEGLLFEEFYSSQAATL
jgi:hypothetical protein